MTTENFKILFVQGKNRANKKNQSPLYCRLTLNGNRKQISTGIHIETEYWKPFLKTITSDNGKEFSKHQSIADTLEIDYFFANPYCSWERGANENLNGLVRHYFAKGSDFNLITDEQVKIVVEKLNNRPRKRHQFNSPKEVYLQKLKINQEFAFNN